MRVLVLSAAILACATAAPSGLLTPIALPYAAIPAVAVPAVAPTVSPGDIEAAAIDAKVQAEDQARALQDQTQLANDQAQLAADQARELAEQAAENQSEKVIEVTDDVQENVQKSFWSGEDKKWQALDAVKTAEAQIDGSIANNAGTIARSALGGVLVPSPLIPVGPIGPVITPYSQVIYAPGIIAPKAELKSELKPEELATKAAEKPEEKPADSVQVESEPLKAQPEGLKSLAPINFVPLAVSPISPVLKYADPWLTPVAYIQPGQQTFAAAAIPQIHGQYLTPTIVSA